MRSGCHLDAYLDNVLLFKRQPIEVQGSNALTDLPIEMETLRGGRHDLRKLPITQSTIDPLPKELLP